MSASTRLLLGHIETHIEEGLAGGPTERADTVAGSQRRLFCWRKWALWSQSERLFGVTQRCSALVPFTKSANLPRRDTLRASEGGRELRAIEGGGKKEEEKKEEKK